MRREIILELIALTVTISGASGNKSSSAWCLHRNNGPSEKIYPLWFTCNVGGERRIERLWKEEVLPAHFIRPQGVVAFRSYLADQHSPDAIMPSASIRTFFRNGFSETSVSPVILYSGLNESISLM